jgi:hypothetical protein
MKKIATILISLVLAVMLFSVGNGHATSLFVGSSYSSGIHSLVNGVAKDEGGGSISPSTLDGRLLDYLYCVDLFNTVYVNTTYANTTVNNAAIIHGKSIVNADHVAYLLGKYGIGGQGEQAQALQAAIWHEINGSGVYDLNVSAYASGSSVVKLYNQYITEAANNVGNIANFLWINPGTDASGLSIYQGLVTTAPVPEPGTMMLLGFGMLGLVIYGKRRTVKATA